MTDRLRLIIRNTVSSMVRFDADDRTPYASYNQVPQIPRTESTRNDNNKKNDNTVDDSCPHKNPRSVKSEATELPRESVKEGRRWKVKGEERRGGGRQRAELLIRG